MRRRTKLTVLALGVGYVVLCLGFLQVGNRSTEGHPAQTSHTVIARTDDMEDVVDRVRDECDISYYFQRFLYMFDCSGSVKMDVGNKNEQKCRIEHIHERCDLLKASFLYGKDDVAEEELAYPLAFSLKIHRSPNQAFQLLRTVYRQHNVYCIHVDRKSHDSLYSMFSAVARCFPNVIVIADRVNVVYSSIRQVEAELKCMEAAARAAVKWKYYINLAGQEFPLKTNLELVRILTVLNGTNDIESYDVSSGHLWRFGLRSRVHGSRLIKTKEVKPKFEPSISIRKGSAYGLFSRDFVHFILRNTTSIRFIAWLNDTYAPEEFVWATLNSLPGAPGGYPGTVSHSNRSFIARAMLWKWENPRCQGRYVRSVCVFGTGDLPWLLSRPELVANKFNENLDRQALYCLERALYERLLNIRNVDPSIGQLFTSFYRNLPQLKHNTVTANSVHEKRPYVEDKHFKARIILGDDGSPSEDVQPQIILQMPANN